jgi:hypothetical protein
VRRVQHYSLAMVGPVGSARAQFALSLVLLRRLDPEAFGGFSLFDRLQFGRVRHEEWEFTIRAVKQLGYRLVTVAEPLVTYYPRQRIRLAPVGGLGRLRPGPAVAGGLQWLLPHGRHPRGSSSRSGTARCSRC